MIYEERVCCFIDVLGFKQLLKGTVSKDKEESKREMTRLNSALMNIKSLENEPNYLKEKSLSRKVSQFSDSIVISYSIEEPYHIRSLIMDLFDTICVLCLKGVLIRGGISKGKLVHSDKYLYGPALVTAYELEDQAANYPRIILDSELVKMLDEGAGSFDSKKTDLIDEHWKELYLEKDSDDMFYIDYISSEVENNLSHHIRLDEYMLNLKRKCLELIYSNSPSVKVKGRWLANKYNKWLIKDGPTQDEIVQRQKDLYYETKFEASELTLIKY